MQNIKKISVKQILLITVSLLVLVGLIFFFLQSRGIIKSSNTQIGTKNELVSFNDKDMRILPSRVPDLNNSALSFRSFKSESINKADYDFITKEATKYTSDKLPPVSQSQKVLASNIGLLEVFDQNVNKEYQCSVDSGDTCPLASVRNAVFLATIRSLVDLQQKKKESAQTTAKNIVTFGKSITKNSDNIITLLVGWLTQVQGYGLLSTLNAGKNGMIPFSNDEKIKLVSTLKSEQKNVLKFEYTRISEIIDYIDNVKKKPSFVIDPDQENILSTYRKSIVANPSRWNPMATKKYFYDSYKVNILNVDLACGANQNPSSSDVKYDIKDTQAENYLGKTFYVSGYASLDSINDKRCDVEKIISKM